MAAKTGMIHRAPSFALLRAMRASALKQNGSLLLAMREPEAPGTPARVAAATKMLELSNGRPGQAKPITVADLPSMTQEQRKELLAALLFQYETEMPGQFKQLLQEITDQAMDLLMSRMAAAPPPRLTHQPTQQVITARKVTRPEPSPSPPDNVVTLDPPSNGKSDSNPVRVYNLRRL
jgi:hypothetical protein